MSKIDLSKAKVGDKFRLITNKIVTYICNVEYDGELWHRVMFEDGRGLDIDDMWIEENLVEQVFDKGDLLDNNISVEERGQAIVGMAKSEYEKAKELSVTFQNLPHIVEQPKEDNPELQRRQEVVELARKMLLDDNTYQFYTQFYVRAKQNEGAEQVMTYLQYVMDYAEDCVNKFNQYLNEGKL